MTCTGCLSPSRARGYATGTDTRGLEEPVITHPETVTFLTYRFESLDEIRGRVEKAGKTIDEAERALDPSTAHLPGGMSFMGVLLFRGVSPCTGSRNSSITSRRT